MVLNTGLRPVVTIFGWMCRCVSHPSRTHYKISHLMTQRSVTNKRISALINTEWLLHQPFWCWNRDILGGLGQYQGTSSLRFHREGNRLYKSYIHIYICIYIYIYRLLAGPAIGRIECPRVLCLVIQSWRAGSELTGTTSTVKSLI